ncbi:MAG TPA: gluconate 2-dehydrogenase subunit 3 family protein [Vicinamibacteria bacterium]|nr:gluconate 2-dehydrogenase subunit 3 family protein [Vicinamibacteria bacterium]
MSPLDRREALRRLGRAGLGAASAPLWFESLAALAQEHAAHGAPPAPAADWAPKVLDAHQDEMVAALSELIIPETDTPGAKAVLVNRFVDAVLDDADEADRKSFLRGLEWMDARSRELFGDEFLKASPDQKTALLTILSSGKNTALEDQIGVEFFAAIKAMTIQGYYTTEVALRQELHLDGQLFHAEFRGCGHPEHGGAPAAPPRKAP